ncbi:hypothetical protein [Streptomyces cucumeris]|uniref:hypothetical protein n=1 Tax=Streptomyces cucumeris TaxID=2962890 RepID=UPI003D7283C7
MTSRNEAEQLHRALDDLADSIPATPIRMDDILHATRKRRARRRIAGITAGCALLLAPLSYLATVDSSTSSVVSPAASAPPNTARVVAPGEKITVAPGVKMWLTQDGKQCLQHSSENTPWCQTLADGKPGANLAGLDSNDHRAWLSGGYLGNGIPDRAQIRTLSGTTHATVITLAGNPGWGAWYAQTRTTSAAPADNKHPTAFLRNVTVYDTAGKTIVTTNTPPAADDARDRISPVGTGESASPDP